MPPFLKINENKKELFHFLSQQLAAVNTERGVVYSTKDEDVVVNTLREDREGLAPCSHEEADSRLRKRRGEGVHETVLPTWF